MGKLPLITGVVLLTLGASIVCHTAKSKDDIPDIVVRDTTVKIWTESKDPFTDEIKWSARSIYDDDIHLTFLWYCPIDDVHPRLGVRVTGEELDIDDSTPRKFTWIRTRTDDKKYQGDYVVVEDVHSFTIPSYATAEIGNGKEFLLEFSAKGHLITRTIVVNDDIIRILTAPCPQTAAYNPFNGLATDAPTPPVPPQRR